MSTYTFTAAEASTVDVGTNLYEAAAPLGTTDIRIECPFDINQCWRALEVPERPQTDADDQITQGTKVGNPASDFHEALNTIIKKYWSNMRDVSSLGGNALFSLQLTRILNELLSKNDLSDAQAPESGDAKLSVSKIIDWAQNYQASAGTFGELVFTESQVNSCLGNIVSHQRFRGSTGEVDLQDGDMIGVRITFQSAVDPNNTMDAHLFLKQTKDQFIGMTATLKDADGNSFQVAGDGPVEYEIADGTLAEDLLSWGTTKEDSNDTLSLEWYNSSDVTPNITTHVEGATPSPALTLGQYYLRFRLRDSGDNDKSESQLFLVNVV